MKALSSVESRLDVSLATGDGSGTTIPVVNPAPLPNDLFLAERTSRFWRIRAVRPQIWRLPTW